MINHKFARKKVVEPLESSGDVVEQVSQPRKVIAADVMRKIEEQKKTGQGRPDGRTKALNIFLNASEHKEYKIFCNMLDKTMSDMLRLLMSFAMNKNLTAEQIAVREDISSNGDVSAKLKPVSVFLFQKQHRDFKMYCNEVDATMSDILRCAIKYAIDNKITVEELESVTST